MSKPGRRENKPSSEIARFTNRQEHRIRLYTLLRSIDEPPVLMFYGLGGAGKTWLLKKLRDHQLWRELWEARSQSKVAEAAPLAWYHRYSLEPSNALTEWQKLTETARTSVSPRMREHFDLLRWREPINLLRIRRFWQLKKCGRLTLWVGSVARRFGESGREPATSHRLLPGRPAGPHRTGLPARA